MLYCNTTVPGEGSWTPSDMFNIATFCICLDLTHVTGACSSVMVVSCCVTYLLFVLFLYMNKAISWLVRIVLHLSFGAFNSRVCGIGIAHCWRPNGDLINVNFYVIWFHVESYLIDTRTTFSYYYIYVQDEKHATCHLLTTVKELLKGLSTYKEHGIISTRGIWLNDPILTGRGCVLVHTAQQNGCPTLATIFGEVVQWRQFFPISSHFLAVLKCSGYVLVDYDQLYVILCYLVLSLYIINLYSMLLFK